MDLLDLQRRAATGDLAAQTVLGACFVEGLGVDVDHVQALRLLAGPAQRGVPRACYYLGRIYASGLGVPVNMAEALRLYERASAGGEFFAMMELGRAYASGAGVAPDSAMARRWYQAAVAEENTLEGCDAELGEAKAYLQLSK